MPSRRGRLAPSTATGSRRGRGVEVAPAARRSCRRRGAGRGRRLDAAGRWSRPPGSSGLRYTFAPTIRAVDRHPLDLGDPADHRRRRHRQLAFSPIRRLAVRDGQQVRAEAVDLGQQPRLARRREAQHRDHRGHPDGDPERRQRGAQPPRAQADARHAGEVGGAQPDRDEAAHAGFPSATIRPSSISTRRGSSAASSGSWVIDDDRRAVAVELLEQLQDRDARGAVEVAGRLVGEHDRRPPHERARDRHPLAFAAGELRRPERRAVREADAVERLGRPRAAARARRRRRRAGRRRRSPAPVECSAR